jgi:threonyl-tRNA synthetase
MEGRRANETTAGTITIPASGKIGGAFKLSNGTGFSEARGKLFEEIYQRQKAQLDAREKREIDITLPDGKIMKGKCWETTGLEIAKRISKKLAEVVVACKVVYSKKDQSEFGGEVADVDGDDDHHIQLDKGELYDLTRPFEGDCSLELLKFDDPLGKTVFWHSSAHILGASLEAEFGGYLCAGPPLENGFFYDVYIGEHRITPDHYDRIEKRFKKIAEENHSFQKIYLTKQEALQLFKDNPFKVQLLTHKIPDTAIVTAYRSGSLIDLCTGPHLPTSKLVKAFKITKTSAAYWLGKNTNDDLQRVYGVSFPSDKQLDEYVKLQEEIEKRDHRNIGTGQELFFFSQLSPGSAFFYPAGAVIYNRLIDLIRREYKVRGYSEVITPNMYSNTLWQTSGHWAKYKDNMFTFKVEEQDFGLKPMNCPGHCILFDSILRSYKELPLRFADFGVLHRNELSGALSGLTRVRRFQQDDAHIFCTVEQIQEEILAVLDFLEHVYGILGFEFKFELSTRPEGALGEKELWDKAEAALADALNRSGHPWKENPGDGAFYGPKIDIKVSDALKRDHQLGTIQLDFNLPIRFNLQYRTAETEEAHEEEKEEKKEKPVKAPKVPKEKKVKKGKKGEGEAPVEGEVAAEGEKPVEEAKPVEEVKPAEETKPSEETQSEHSHAHSHSHHHKHEENHLKTGFTRPVMIHRAVLGSVERMLAILCEHTGGKWPFWLSPRQIKVIPISEKFIGYAEAVAERLKLEGYAAELDRTNFTINKKVRNAQIAQFNYIAVAGEEEMKSGSVDLRERDNKDRLGKYTIDGLLQLFESKKLTPSQAEIKLKSRAYFNVESSQNELDAHNNELLLKSFLEGTTQPGQKDLDLFEKLKDVTVDSAKHPNLFRWKSFIAASKQ